MPHLQGDVECPLMMNDIWGQIHAPDPSSYPTHLPKMESELNFELIQTFDPNDFEDENFYASDIIDMLSDTQDFDQSEDEFGEEDSDHLERLFDSEFDQYEWYDASIISQDKKATKRQRSEIDEKLVWSSNFVFSFQVPLINALKQDELDEEINNIEEEIARIQEHKRSLKQTSLVQSPLNSSLSSPVLNDSDEEIDVVFTFEEIYLSESSNNASPKSNYEDGNHKQLNKSQIKSNPSSQIQHSEQKQILVATNNSQIIQETPKKNKSQKQKTPKKKAKKNKNPKSTTSSRKKLKKNSEVFKIEQVLKIEAHNTDNEDEDVDVGDLFSL